jgi:hypothetical protein
MEQSEDQQISKDLREIFYSLVYNQTIDLFRDEVKKHCGHKNIKKELKEKAIDLVLRKWKGELILDENSEDDEENSFSENMYDEEKSPYFFQRFFYKEGKNFKKRSYNKDWYEINLLCLHRKFNLFKLDEKILIEKPEDSELKIDIKRFQLLSEKIIQAIKSKDESNAVIHSEFYRNTFITELLLNLCEKEFKGWIENYKELINNGFYNRFIDELDVLSELIKSIFRQGSGQIPTFIAEAISVNNDDPRSTFILEMKNLLVGEFSFVTDEIKQVLTDYEKIVERNFDDKNKIRYNLIQQLPVAGISGHHKKDVRKTAIQFRMPGYPYVLITTDILKEGEDLHTYCKNIYHYGIAWNPSDMEQRTGRIDRIDSLAYRALKEVEKQDVSDIPFQNKLQVFYPYLTDTLEVNQMIRLFNGMDRFIEIFYNNLSEKIDKGSKVSVDDIVENIPKQKKGLLESKYDYNSFLPSYNGKKLERKGMIGTTRDELAEKLDKIMLGLDKNNYIVKPEIDRGELIITGIMELFNKRHGPFKLYFHQDTTPGKFNYVLESLLGKIQVLGKSSTKQKIFDKINEYKVDSKLNLNIKESNSYVYLYLILEYDLEIKEIIYKLYQLVEITDNIENEFTGEDERINEI